MTGNTCGKQSCTIGVLLLTASLLPASALVIEI